MKIRLIATICLLLFFSGFTAAAATDDFVATVMVTKISDTADGVCDADCSLREAVIAASSGDTIVFSPIFNSPQTILLTNGQISINKSLIIAGPNEDLLAVSRNNASHIFNISDNAAVTLSGMKLKDGREAINLINSTLTLTNMTLTNNVGGIRSRVGTVNIINSKINNNSGNGVIGLESEVIYVVNSTFNGNSGRAIAGLNGRISVINSTVTNNREGGISNDDSQAILTIDRSIISNNESITFAGRGGGGVLNRGTATISNTTINNNSVSGKGGGIGNTGTINITNSTVSNNSALESGGGIFNAIGQLFLTNSTVSGNVADFGGGFGSSPGGGIYNDNIFGGNVILTVMIKLT
jgi:CSLREA domain-containing protein